MAHNKWYDEEKQIIIDNYENMSDEELCSLIPRHSLTSITTMRKDLQCQRKRGKYSFDVVLMYLEKKGYTPLSESSDYKDACSPIRYLCPMHGEQVTTLGHLIEGKGCKECGWEMTGLKKRLDIDEHIKDDILRCQELDLTHVETYRTNYSDKTNRVRVRYICNKHKDKGVQEIDRTYFYKASYCCSYCYRRSYTHEEIREKLSLFENRFEFLSDDYTKVYDKIWCRCKKHDVTRLATIRDILRGKGCYECGIEKLSEANTLTKEEVEEKIRNVNPKIELISEYKSINEPINVRCKVCGAEWETHTYIMHRCPVCDFFYKGEQLTADCLNELNLEYIPQFKFDDCVYKKRLSFDFYLPNEKICIEYNGQQHYKSCNMFGGEEGFEKQQIRDNIKRQYCKDNGIKLIEIPYTYDTKGKIKEYLKGNM